MPRLASISHPLTRARLNVAAVTSVRETFQLTDAPISPLAQPPNMQISSIPLNHYVSTIRLRSPSLVGSRLSGRKRERHTSASGGQPDVKFPGDISDLNGG